MGRDLQEGADGSAFPNSTFPNAFTSRMWILLSRAGGRRNHKSQWGKYPWGRERCPAPAPSLGIPALTPTMPSSSRVLPAGGIGTLSAATSALSRCPQARTQLRVSDSGGWGRAAPEDPLEQDKRYFLSPSLSFPCQAALGASGAEARPPSDSISDPFNPFRAGLEGQKNRDIPAGEVTRCDRPVLGLVHLL